MRPDAAASCMVELQKHSHRLGQLLKELYDYVPDEHGREEFSFLVAGDWLGIASGIESVKLLTEKFDDSLFYCGNALDYEDKRSLLLSEFVTRLSIFNFIWGGFESIIKVIQPKPVPNDLKKRRSSIDDAIYYLKTNYDPNPRLQPYDDELWKLRMLMSQVRHYQGWLPEFRLQPFLSITGLGLHIIRLIRNDFAHGSAALPIPEDWGSPKTKEILTAQEKIHLTIIDTCSRLLLLTQQMILIGFLKEEHAYSEILKYEENFGFAADAATVAAVLHMDAYPNDRDQLCLFQEHLEYTD